MLNLFKKKVRNNISQNNKEIITFEKLVDFYVGNGNGCMVSNKIAKEYHKVGYMYKEEPMSDRPDSGWHFLHGDEDDEYMNNAKNHSICTLNTICNIDKSILPYLKAPVGSKYVRINEKEFLLDDGSLPTIIIKNNNQRQTLYDFILSKYPTINKNNNELKRILSICKIEPIFIKGKEIRFLSLEEVINYKKCLNIDKENIIPLIDLYDNDFLIYDINQNKFAKIYIADEQIYQYVDSIQEYIDLFDEIK